MSPSLLLLLLHGLVLPLGSIGVSVTSHRTKYFPNSKYNTVLTSSEDTPCFLEFNESVVE